MSTFQASGHSYSNKISIHHQHHQHDGWCGNANGIVDEELYDYSYNDMLKKFGKGLVLDFNPCSATLASGGLDNESVRIWNLEIERCIWEGECVSLNNYPTAITMWKKNHPNIFIAGSSF